MEWMWWPGEEQEVEIASLWEKIKNQISGIWNSSDIGLDLGKLHNQIATMEHSRLDFTAAGTANDFFHTFSNYISGKNMLSTFLSYVTVAVLILLLIFILPCIVRILRQSIQRLATELPTSYIWFCYCLIKQVSIKENKSRTC